MAKLSIVCGLILIFVIHQSKAVRPDDLTVFGKLMETLGIMKNQDPSALTEAVDTFNQKLAGNPTWYAVEWALFFSETDAVLQTIDQDFNKTQYFKNDPQMAEKRTAVKNAIEAFLALYNNDFEPCPAYNTFSSMLSKASQQ